ncbi:hypothetical protein [Paraburkholderia aromaticivorans]|uniref:hypothetical protein n=1 Tax=Paraburkholderia aromaticivorans TaxID=2026199 RepID=UPI0014560881|nr:hypothetical protein [Paraburkholderia aromaticivorans]
MTDAKQMRLWSLLAKVRRLRVERKRRRLNEVRLEAQRATAESVRQREAIGQHEARRTEILAAYPTANRAAPLWRMALHRHDSSRFALEEALRSALHTERLAEARVAAASRALRREMLGEEDACTRVRRIKAAQHQDEGPDD